LKDFRTVDMRKATRYTRVAFFTLFVLYFCAERHQRELCEFETLFPERNTDNGYTPNDTYDKIAKREPKTAEHHPDNVCDGVFPKIGINRFPKGEQREFRHLETLFPKRNTDDCNTPNNP